MKSCPRCGKIYPDAERFCSEDGSELIPAVSGGPATTVMTEEPHPAETAVGGVECPVCGGRSQPGEVICNFCGTRLPITEGPAPASDAAPGAAGRTRVSPENFVPAGDRVAAATEPEPEEEARRSGFGLLVFALAAIIALGGGAWLAIYLSNRHHIAPVAAASPSPGPLSGPTVALAQTIPLQSSAGPNAAAPRDPATLSKIFSDNKSGLEDVYHTALAGNPDLDDGVMLRLHVMPDGSVSDASVRVSTASNPSLDAEVAKTAAEWKFPAATGAPVDADYPVIFSRTSASAPAIESNLSTKLASLGPNEAPEYALAPSVPPSPEVAASPTPPPMAALPPESVTPPPGPAPAPHKHRATAAYRPPPMPLRERINNELAANRKLRRVQVYTSAGHVTLTGKVFDNADKQLAESTVRRVSGVTSVTNNLTTDEQDWARNQSLIMQQLQGAGLTGVTVKVIGKSAYLDGQVKTDAERDQAVAIAQSAAPVTVRTNLIRVVPAGVFGF